MSCCISSSSPLNLHEQEARNIICSGITVLTINIILNLALATLAALGFAGVLAMSTGYAVTTVIGAVLFAVFNTAHFFHLKKTKELL